MKLYSETASVNDIWEVDKENKKDDCKSSSNIKQQRSKSAVMYESAFYNRSKLDSAKKDTFGSLKAKVKVSPSFSKLISDKKSTKQRCSSENVNVVLVNECKKEVTTSKVGSNPNIANSEKLKPSTRTVSGRLRPSTHALKPCLHRGKSDACLNQASRRSMVDFCTDAHTTCRTEYTIPSEFLFCRNAAEHSNKFVSVYDEIRSGSNLRRSQSTGSLGKNSKLYKTKDDFDTADDINNQTSVQAKSDVDVATHKAEGQDSHTDNRPSTCDGSDDTELNKSESNFLANELQSILDDNGNTLNLKKSNSFTSRQSQLKETSFTENNDVDKNTRDVSMPNVQQTTKSRPSTISRRSQSCKSVQRRLSNLFSISKYLKDRHTHRSKSFATIREFSTHDANYRKSSARNMRRNESIGYYDTSLAVADEYYETDEQLRKPHAVSNDIELTPTKTTKSFDVNHTDAHGNSCLHHASSKGDISTIKYLLEQGGDVWVKNDEHRLPIDLAQNFQTAKLLSSATLFYSEQNEPRKEKNIVQTSKLNIAL